MTRAITKCIDYAGVFDEFESYREFCADVVTSLRQGKPDSKEALVLLIDRGFNLGKSLAMVVSDHLNLTGASPLIGPNDPIGPRFPVINNIYFVPRSTDLERAVVAGLKPGIEPTDAEIAQLNKLGAFVWSYNTTQTMLVAAHAGWNVLAVLVSDSSLQRREQTRELLSNFLKAEDLKIDSIVGSKRKKEQSANVS